MELGYIFYAAVVFTVGMAAAVMFISADKLTHEAARGSGENDQPKGFRNLSAVGVAEVVMILVAMFAGKQADGWRRKPLFLIAFAFLAVRNGLNVVRAINRSSISCRAQCNRPWGGWISEQFGIWVYRQIAWFQCRVYGPRGGLLYQFRMPETKPS